ncbi:hypothetical protein I4U23_000084 [Adineta vaga]|nr:hypothetical protein I4U23_000084 [Adineta vaga]
MDKITASKSTQLKQKSMIMHLILKYPCEKFLENYKGLKGFMIAKSVYEFIFQILQSPKSKSYNS